MFKVIIVGGGPVGLVAAHALHRAEIDFVLLERSVEVGRDVGASLVLGPNNLRVLAQLGLLEALLAISGELRHSETLTKDSVKFGESTRIQDFQANFGIGLRVFHRAELVRTLYGQLPKEAQQKFFLNKKVMSVDCNEKGARVVCADGTITEGSIVLGADGVKSTTRRYMRELAIQDGYGTEMDPEPPSSRRTDVCGVAFLGQRMAAKAPRLRARIVPACSWADTSVDGCFYKDVQIHADSFAEWPLTEVLKMKDAWAERTTSGMANLEEGILRQWSWQRIVLVGDACHKYTPNAGQGLNDGIQDVVALCNGLHKFLTIEVDTEPTTAALQNVFQEYQAIRLPTVQLSLKLSRAVTRLHAWRNWIYMTLARYIMPFDFIQNFLINFLTARKIKKGLVLNFAAVDQTIRGVVEWDHS